MISQKVLSSSAFCRLFSEFADYEEVQGVTTHHTLSLARGTYLWLTLTLGLFRIA